LKTLLVVTTCSPGTLPTQGLLIAQRFGAAGIATSVITKARTGWGRTLDVVVEGFWKTARHDVVLVDLFGNRSFFRESVAILYGRVLRKRVVAMIRGGWFGESVARWPRWTRYVLGRADAVLTPHAYLFERLSALGVRVSGTIPNSIDLEQYTFRRRTSFGPRFLFLRGTHPQYNPMMTLRAFELIQRRYPDAQLTMGGPEYDGSRPCREYVNAVGIKNVVFVGRVPKSEISGIAEAHDVYVQSNRIENMPVTVLEMWACGLPVVATDIGGTPYLVRNGIDGLLVPSDDHTAMAAACLDLLDEPEKGRILAANGRERVEDFSWKRVEPRWRHILELDA
jgi:glycosyltransferase involved in cell wall biosynthesis